MKYWRSYIALQSSMGGNSNRGTELGDLLRAAEFRDIQLNFRTVHADDGDPVKKRDLFTFWRDLMASALPKLLDAGLVTPEEWSGVKAELEALADLPGSTLYCAIGQASARV